MSSIYIPLEIPNFPTIYHGTLTEKNMWIAYVGESMARNKYTYFASVARKAGYEQMADIFLSTAENEKEHAKIWFKELNQLKDHRDNLALSVDSEHYEWSTMYTHMADVAIEEGFPDLAKLFLSIAEIEKRHEERFRSLLRQIDNDEVFSRNNLCLWECKNCGHIMVAASAPEECPVCNHPQAFFRVITADRDS